MAAELGAPGRDVILASSGGEPPAWQPRQQPRTIPIVFAIGGDPIKAGLVASLQHGRVETRPA